MAKGMKARIFKDINYECCEKITLNVSEIEPESLIGLLQNVSDVGTQSFPDIFRFWQQRKKGD